MALIELLECPRCGGTARRITPPGVRVSHKECGYDSEGRYIPNKPPDHVCRTPGFFSRLIQGVPNGQIWECPCGRQWRFLRMVGWEPWSMPKSSRPAPVAIDHKARREA